MDQLGEPCNNFWIQACGSRLLQKESCKERSYKPNWHLTWSNPPNLSFSNSLLSKAAPMTIKKHSTKKFNRSIVKDENNETVLTKKKSKYHTNGSRSSLPAVINQILHTIYDLSNLEEPALR